MRKRICCFLLAFMLCILSFIPQRVNAEVVSAGVGEMIGLGYLYDLLVSGYTFENLNNNSAWDSWQDFVSSLRQTLTEPIDNIIRTEIQSFKFKYRNVISDLGLDQWLVGDTVPSDYYIPASGTVISSGISFFPSLYYGLEYAFDMDISSRVRFDASAPAEFTTPILANTSTFFVGFGRFGVSNITLAFPVSPSTSSDSVIVNALFRSDGSVIFFYGSPNSPVELPVFYLNNSVNYAIQETVGHHFTGFPINFAWFWSSGGSGSSTPSTSFSSFDDFLTYLSAQFTQFGDIYVGDAFSQAQLWNGGDVSVISHPSAYDIVMQPDVPSSTIDSDNTIVNIPALISAIDGAIHGDGTLAIDDVISPALSIDDAGVVTGTVDLVETFVPTLDQTLDIDAVEYQVPTVQVDDLPILGTQYTGEHSVLYELLYATLHIMPVEPFYPFMGCILLALIAFLLSRFLE